MSELPPNPHESDPVDELYRRASALDASRPSESVRRAVLDHMPRNSQRRRQHRAPAQNQPGASRDQRRPAHPGTNCGGSPRPSERSRQPVSRGC